MPLTDLLYSVGSQSMIGAMTLDVLLSEQVHLPSLVTEYPVENGSNISDDIIPQARRLMLSGSIATGSLMTFGAYQNGSAVVGKAKLQDAKSALEAIYAARTPVTIVTGLYTYSNYAMTSCEMTRTGDGSATFLDIRAEFVEITTVSNQTVAVAPDVAPNPAPSVAKAASKTKQAAGQVTGGTTSAAQQSSVLSRLLSLSGGPSGTAQSSGGTTVSLGL